MIQFLLFFGAYLPFSHEFSSHPLCLMRLFLGSRWRWLCPWHHFPAPFYAQLLWPLSYSSRKPMLIHAVFDLLRLCFGAFVRHPGPKLRPVGEAPPPFLASAESANSHLPKNPLPLVLCCYAFCCALIAIFSRSRFLPTKAETCPSASLPNPNLNPPPRKTDVELTFPLFCLDPGQARASFLSGLRLKDGYCCVENP